MPDILLTLPCIGNRSYSNRAARQNDAMCDSTFDSRPRRSIPTGLTSLFDGWLSAKFCLALLDPRAWLQTFFGASSVYRIGGLSIRTPSKLPVAPPREERPHNLLRTRMELNPEDPQTKKKIGLLTGRWCYHESDAASMLF